MKTTRIILSALILILPACDGGNGAFDTAWSLFESGKYQEAKTEFEAHISDGSEAYVGLGWSSLRMDSISAADGYFAQIIGDTLIDGYAGLVAVKWAQRDYANTILFGDVVLLAQFDYIFSHDVTVNNQDIALHQAFAYYALGNLSGCISKIRQVDPDFSNGVNDPGIEDIILAKLTSLGLNGL